jgi:hypothetical protein
VVRLESHSKTSMPTQAATLCHMLDQELFVCCRHVSGCRR